MAARDFEDLLQCAIPAFEGLLPPEQDAPLMKLLYRMAEWHTLAKLRMHNDSTLTRLTAVTTDFARLMRSFQKLTLNVSTTELPKEARARVRRQAKAAEAQSRDPAKQRSQPQKKQRKSKKDLNLRTYKYHSLFDYISYIHLFGPSGSWSTQVVSSEFLAIDAINIKQGELAHRVVKRLYAQTNKQDAPRQIAYRYIREAQVKRRAKRREEARHRLQRRKSKANTSRDTIDKPEPKAEPISMESHHKITMSRNHPVNIYTFVQSHTSDPAVKVSVAVDGDNIITQLFCRTSSLNSRTTYSGDSLIGNLMETLMGSSTTTTETVYESRGMSFSKHRR